MGKKIITILGSKLFLKYLDQSYDALSRKRIWKKIVIVEEEADNVFTKCQWLQLYVSLLYMWHLKNVIIFLLHIFAGKYVLRCSLEISQWDDSNEYSQYKPQHVISNNVSFWQV